MVRGDPPEGKETISRKQRDFDDLQNELAGRETGRISRFFNESRRGPVDESARKRDETIQFLTNLELLMQDPAYAALYKDTSDLLRRAEKAADKALSRAEDAFEMLMDKAVRLPDGRAVFKDKTGKLRTEDGGEIDAALIAGMTIPEDAPSYEAYVESKDRVEDIRRYRVETLGDARERLTDEDNPLDMDELEQLNKDIEEGMEVITRRSEPSASGPDSTKQLSSDIDVPHLGG